MEKIVLLSSFVFLVTFLVDYCRAEELRHVGASSSVGSNLEERILKLERQIEILKGDRLIHKRSAFLHLLKRELPAAEVGFYVKLETTIKVRKGETIKFDSAVTRIGNAYNTTTGVFTCVQPGTYMFSMSIVADRYNYIEGAIMRNEVPILKTVSDSQAGRVRNQGGGTAIMQLSRGDNVSVTPFWFGSGFEGTVYGNGLSSFSGYLLRDSR